MFPALEGARADRRLRRPAPGRARRQLPDRAVAGLRAARQRRGDKVHRLDGIARDSGAGSPRSSRSWASASADPEPIRRVERAASPGPWWRTVAEHRGAGMSLLLGIDEGTSAVKAVVYDEDLKTLAEGRREKALQHPQPGWVEQDPEEILEAVVGAVADALEGAPGEIAACGLDHQGESVLAWDAETGRPDHAGRHVAGQALAGDPRPARGRWQRRSGSASAAGCRSTPTSRPASSRGCSSTTTRSGARATPARCGSARSTPSSASASAPSSRPTSRPRRERSSPFPASRDWDDELLEHLRRPARGRCRRSRTRPATSACCATSRGRSSCRCAPGSSTSRRRSPARAASSAG